MLTRPWQARRHSVPSFAVAELVSSTLTATALILTNGCSPISIVTASLSPNREALIRSLSILPEYLRNQATESGSVFDYRDWQIPLGRRFRSLKLWFVIRHYGVEGLQHHIRYHVQLAQEFLGWVQHDDRFEVVAPAPLNLVCFRYRGSDEQNQRLMEGLNGSGDLYLTHTRLSRPLRAALLCRANKHGSAPRGARVADGSRKKPPGCSRLASWLKSPRLDDLG